MIGLQHYEIAQWTNIGPGGEWARGTLKVNWSKLPNMKSGPGNSVQTAYTDFDCNSAIVG